MNCVELRESLAENEDGSRPEQRAHLKGCRECSALLTDLRFIASEAIDLRGAHEPNPRVWKGIEATLRREGIIRPQSAGRSLLPSFHSPWAMARWMVPAAAAILFAIGIYLRPHNARPDLSYSPTVSTASVTGSDPQVAGLNDDDLLQELDQQPPALKQEYTEHLQHVNQYIQDAKSVVASNPDDEEARRALMEAYQEKAMLFELALDRSLP